MTDWYIGRKGAFNELLQATEILLNNKIAPRWQVFINANNSADIIKLLAKSKELKLSDIKRGCITVVKPEPLSRKLHIGLHSATGNSPRNNFLGALLERQRGFH